jgi:hypothetical protein
MGSLIKPKLACFPVTPDERSDHTGIMTQSLQVTPSDADTPTA